MHWLYAEVLTYTRGDATQQMVVRVAKRATWFPDDLAHTSMMLAWNRYTHRFRPRLCPETPQGVVRQVRGIPRWLLCGGPLRLGT